jgi:WD40 repeat protein
LTADGRQLVVAGERQSIDLIDIASGAARRLGWTPASRPLSMAVAPGKGFLVAALSDGSVQAWDIERDRELFTLAAGTTACSLDMSPSGLQFAVGTTQGMVQVWNLVADGTRSVPATTPQLAWEGRASVTGHVTARFSPDGRRLATATAYPDDWRVAGTAKLWDVEQGRELLKLGDHSAGLRGVCFDGEGSRVATFGSFYDVRLWSTATGAELPRVYTRASVVGAEFIRGDDTLVVALQTGKLVGFSVRTGQLTRAFVSQPMALDVMVASRGGGTIATLDRDRRVSAWFLSRN